MPLSDTYKNIQTLTLAVNNESERPEERIKAARKLLRDTDFSDRSCRVAKRLAKFLIKDESQTEDIRNRAEVLLKFILNRIEDAEVEETSAAANLVSSTELSCLAPHIEGLNEFDLTSLTELERKKFFAELWKFGASLGQQLDRRREPPSETEIISVAAARLILEPDFFTWRYLREGVLEQVTKEIGDGRDRSRPLWKISPSYEIVTSEYRDALGDKFVQRISEIAESSKQ